MNDISYRVEYEHRNCIQDSGDSDIVYALNRYRWLTHPKRPDGLTRRQRERAYFAHAVLIRHAGFD